MLRAKVERAGQSIYETHIVKAELRREQILSSGMATFKGKIIRLLNSQKKEEATADPLPKDAHGGWGTWDTGQMLCPVGKVCQGVL